MTPASSAAAITARAPSARSSGLACRRSVGPGAGSGSAASASGSPAQSSSSSTLRGDRRGPLDEGADALGVRPAGARDTHPPALHEPQVDEHLAARHVLVDLAVGEPGQRRLVADDEHLGLAGSGGLWPARTTSSARRSAASGSPPMPCGPLMPRPPPARCGTGRRTRRGPRGRPGGARPCRSSASPTSTTRRRRRRRPSSATARR